MAKKLTTTTMVVSCAFALLFVQLLLSVSAEETASSSSSSKSTVTGHRFIRGGRDFDSYIIRESLPTLLLVHSSNEADCDPTQASCAEMFEDVKAAAAETKGYVRFATVDFADEEAKKLVTDVLKLAQKPPIMVAFREKAGPGTTGRPGMRMPLQARIGVAQLKQIASGMLPIDVHQSQTVADFEKLLQSGEGKKPLVIALFAPKLSSKPTPMVKAAWAMLKGVANFTLVDYSTDAGKDIVKIVEGAFTAGEATPVDKNETFVIGIDETGTAVKSNETAVSPDSIHDFAAWLNFKRGNKKSSSSEGKKEAAPPKRKPIPGIYSNLTHEEFDRLAMRPNTASVLAIRRREDVPPVTETDMAKLTPSSENITWASLAQTMFTQFGIHSGVILCEHPTDAPRVCNDVKSEWTFLVVPHRSLSSKGERKVLKAQSLKDAMDKAVSSFWDAQTTEDDSDKLETFDTPSSASDFVQTSMAFWANPSLKGNAKLPVIYMDIDDSGSSEPPSFLTAAHATVRPIAKIVRIKNPSAEVLKQLHLDPATTFLPTMVAYVPQIQEAKESDEHKEGGKTKSKKGAPPKGQQMSYHVIPFDPKRSGFGPNAMLQYETAVLFIQDLFHHVDEARWQSFMENDFPLTAPPALSNPVTERLSKSKPQDVSRIPAPVQAVDKDTFKTACGDAGLCIVVFAEKFDEARMQAIELSRQRLEKAGLGSGIRFTLVDGSCHINVVEALGGDPTMLPVVAAFNPSKNVFSTMRGAFTSDNIQSFVRSAKRGALGVQPVAKSPADSFSNLKDCIVPTDAVTGAQEPEEDDLLKELREEAEREAKAKELARKQAEEEGKRLKEQREADLKRQRDIMNKLAEEERLKKRKAQQELDEQRLAKKKEQQRLDEERLASSKKKKEEL